MQDLFDMRRAEQTLKTRVKLAQVMGRIGRAVHLSASKDCH